MRSIFDRPLFLLGAFASLLLAANEVRFETRMPLGGDFSQIWLAGYLVDRGDSATLYVPTAFSSAGQGLIERAAVTRARTSALPSAGRGRTRSAAGIAGTSI